MFTRDQNIASFHLAVASTGSVESQSIPTLILSGSMWNSVRGLSPRRRSGYVFARQQTEVRGNISNFPAAILFSLFQPEFDQAADGFG
jgi:hypothetical protein